MQDDRPVRVIGPDSALMYWAPQRLSGVKLLVVSLPVQGVLQVGAVDPNPLAVGVDLLLVDPDIGRTLLLQLCNPCL